ncbi:energy transducer TonB, partial [Halorhodospira neutriphila]
PEPGAAPDRSAARAEAPARAPSSRDSPEPGQQARDALKAYKAELRAAIGAHKRYPLMARRLRRQGQVVVEFAVHADGRIADVRIVEGAGAASLERAAREAVEAVGRFRALPGPVQAPRKRFRIAMRFEL